MLKLEWTKVGRILGTAGRVCCILAASFSIGAKTPERPDADRPVPSDQPIPVIDFFRPPLLYNAVLNQTGTRFTAQVSKSKDRTSLLVYDLTTRQMKSAGESDFDFYNVHWLDERRLLFQVGLEKLYSYALYTAEADDLAHMVALDRYDVVYPISSPRKEPLKPFIWIAKSSETQGTDGGVVQIDAKGLSNFDRDHRIPVLRSFQNPPGGGSPVGYWSDVNGELAAAVTRKDGIARLHYLRENGWKTSSVNLDESTVIGPGDRPGEFIVSTRDRVGKPDVLRRLDVASDKMGEVLYRDDNYDPLAVSFYRHPKDGHILGLNYQRKGPQSFWFDPSYAELQAVLSKTLPDDVVRIMGSDKQEKQFFVFTGSDRNPGRYLLFDREHATLSSLIEVSPWIDPKRMQPMQLMTYKSADGIPIEGYLTLPAGASKETPPPLIVLPHGGPWVRDAWGWDPEAQFFANRGYAVFQPNYRGSPGFGWRFAHEDNWAFRKMHDDVTAGTHALIKAGLVDPARIAIMGGSFGGYLAICGASFEPNLYRCAISIAGVFDWQEVMNHTQESYNDYGKYGYLLRHLGDPKTQKEKFDNMSPLHAVDNITIPIFVAHGRDDPIASVNESKRLIRALEKRHIPFEAMIESGEPHGFAHLEKNVELYTRIEAFLAKHLAAKPGTSAKNPLPAAQ